MIAPSARDSANAGATAGSKVKQQRTAGAGGEISRKEEALPNFRLGILDRTLVLKRISLLLEQPEGYEGIHDGVLGIDALKGGFMIDFRGMQIRLD